MLNPPLYLELTSFQTGLKEPVLLSLIDGMSPDPETGCTIIKHYLPNQLVTFPVKETVEVILRKAQKVTLNYHRLIRDQMSKDPEDSWRDDGEDGTDEISIIA